jgi:hypothetical protein
MTLCCAAPGYGAPDEAIRREAHRLSREKAWEQCSKQAAQAFLWMDEEWKWMLY